MKTKTFRVIVLILLFCTYKIQAAFVELPLACEGRYDPNSPVWTIDFDLGVRFIEMSHVYMDWSGEITAGLATDPKRPGPQPFPIDVGLSAYLGSNPWPRLVTVYGGEETYPDQESFDSRIEFELLGATTWSDILDGKGKISIGYASLGTGAGCPGSGCGSIIDFGFVALNEATLVIEGTIVPEPATFLLLGIGSLLFRKKR